MAVAPAAKPVIPLVTSFAMKSLKGFGLMQRDRTFANYEDTEARYEMRPSAWVTPVGDWGAGRVELLQFATPDETHDNVAAYWVPEKMPAPGQSLDIAWQISWQGKNQQLPPNGWVTQSRRGFGFSKGRNRPHRPGPVRHRLCRPGAGRAARGRQGRSDLQRQRQRPRARKPGLQKPRHWRMADDAARAAAERGPAC
jgi:glucan biosynthesis protein